MKSDVHIELLPSTRILMNAQEILVMQLHRPVQRAVTRPQMKVPTSLQVKALMHRLIQTHPSMRVVLSLTLKI